MTGFGLYELLRIFLPGAVAAAVLDLVLRLATGSGPLLAEGPAKSVIASMTGVTFVFTALVLGFLLYLADLPIKARVHRQGDPVNGFEMPFKALDRVLAQVVDPSAKQWAETRCRSIYFLLTDAHLPEELFKHVYFFGGMYKMYFDTRIVTMAVLAFGPALGLVIVSDKTHGRGLEVAYVWPALLCIALVVIAGGIAEFHHAKESIKKNGPGYGGRLRHDLRRVSWIAAVIFLTQTLGWNLADQRTSYLTVIGFILCAISLVLWIMSELGPPNQYAPGTKFWQRGLRDSVLLKMGCEETDRTQYMPAQRTLVDLALIAGALSGAATLTVQQGRSPWSVLLWGGLVLVPILIMVIRKHEIHLLRSYNDQSTWFELNKNNIIDWASNGPSTTKEWA